MHLLALDKKSILPKSKNTLILDTLKNIYNTCNPKSPYCLNRSETPSNQRQQARCKKKVSPYTR